MSWVRLDDKAMDHPKILLLTDSQFRLWIKGLCYAQKHLTDGFIPALALKPMLPKAGDSTRLCEVVLWEVVTDGFQVHDFLQWNDSRERVQERKDAAETEKIAHRVRTKGWREKKRAKREASLTAISDVRCDASHIRHSDESVTCHGDSTVPFLTKPNQTLVQEDQTLSALLVSPEADRQLPPRMSGTTDPELARRAGDFFADWQKLYTKERFGATYHSRPHIDYANACNLVRNFSNARLSDLAVVFLNSNEPFIENSTRSLAVFESRISWCDEQLRKIEAKQQRSA